METLDQIKNTTSITTRSGQSIDLTKALNPEQFTIEDIACGLSKICRFNGQIPEFYSVAQHSIMVSRSIADPELRLMGLLHDAAEAYIGDVIKPLKNMIKEIYGPIEEAFERWIFRKFNLDFDRLPEIKPFDIAIYQLESLKFRHGNNREWMSMCAMLKLDSKCWSPEWAYHRFMREFCELTGGNMTDFIKAEYDASSI